MTKGMALTLKGVGVTLGTSEILRGIDLSVNRGEFVVIVGKSGSGKTTLLRAVAGSVCHQGFIHREGRMRMVFQEHLLLPWLRVIGNVQIGRSCLSFFSSPSALTVELLKDFGIWHLRSRFPGELSGGEKQRVAIARAFADRPDIILMDEPFGSLDVFTREQMQTWLLDSWSQRRSSVLFVTHDVEEGLILGDRVIVLDRGRFVADDLVPFRRQDRGSLRQSREFFEMKQRIRGLIMDV